MVWVSNRGNSTIHVSITNTSGGSADAYSIFPQSSESENSGKNSWRRSGPETLTMLREGGKEQLITVGPSDFVRVYSDAVVVTQANVFVA